MSKIVSPRAELVVLRGMVHKDKKIAGTLLAAIDSSYFYSPESVEIYEAILRIRTAEGHSPSYRLLLEDPDISEEARSHFRDSVAIIQTIKDAERAARILNNYRQKRGLYNLAAHIGQQLKSSKASIEDCLQYAASTITTIRAKKSTDDAFLHFGKNNNSLKVVESILYDDNSEELIPTGIKAFDDVSGGLARGALFSIGAPSGGGKSVLASALAVNMASLGYKVLLVPLEMSKREMTKRIIANVTNTDLTKVSRQLLATGERELVLKRFKRWLKRVKERGGRYTLFKPTEDLTLEEILASTSVYDADVVIIDYISLLKGVDGDDQVRALGAVARSAKINAENTNKVNVLLSQVTEEGKLKYSRATTEHSSNSWVMTVTAESKETGITKVDQPKSRNSLSFPFLIRIDYATMRVYDVEAGDADPGVGPISKKDKEIPNLAADV